MKLLRMFLLFIIIILPFIFPQKTFALIPNGWPCVTVPSNMFQSLCNSGFCKAATTQRFPGQPGVCTALATCMCTNPGNSNAFRCTLGSNQVNATCQQKGAICINKSNYIQDPRNDILGGAGLGGIQCKTTN